MQFRRSTDTQITWMLAAMTTTLLACVPSDTSPPRGALVSKKAAFVNGGFETGGAGVTPPAPWTVTTYLNGTGVTIQTPQTRAGLNLAAGGAALTTTIVSATGPGMQPDPDLGMAASLRWPRYGNQCARVNFHGSTAYGHGENVNSLKQTMTIGATDVDPSDNQIHVRFAIAPVLQNPAHPLAEQPYYFVQLTNVTQNTIIYTDFNLSAQPGVPWKTVNGGTAAEIDYVDWSLVDIAPGSPKLNMGDQVTLEVMASGCQPGAHFGEVYVDGNTGGASVPGIFVSGTGPAQANPGTNITYNITYKNGSAAAETGVVIDFTTPPGTTYQSITRPTGATCTTPAVGALGTIVCTFAAAIAAGAAGTFTITVNINSATTGKITCGNYDIHSNQETPLLGSKIYTLVGCNVDGDCTGGNWCNESAHTCGPPLANGISMPTDAAHTNPTLNGACTAQAGALVCTSAVCDTADNKCGYANGDGTCGAAKLGVCRSSVCDPDLKCGYANGDGPCTAGTAGTVCRSGACSANGLCEPVGGCNVDADCTGGKWCNEGTHACTSPLANGIPMPTDPTHASPTLNGACTAAAAALVCVAGVCDTTDNKCGYLNNDGPCTAGAGNSVCRSTVCDPDGRCGYANGDGPCTAGNGGTVCRSGACSTNGLCEPAGGCNVDSDCSAGWCDESTSTCTSKLVNGIPVPSDPPHANPALNGTCTAAAGALVCASAVCDVADNKCGYANGDGPCTAGTAGAVCRSSACSVNGTCEPASGCNVDGDCAAGNWCNETMHVCTPSLANGTTMPTDSPHTSPILDGTCAASAANLVCTSGVCDVGDNKCGYANGDGPCTGGAVCRSGACSVSGLCEPEGGCNVDADCASGNWCKESAHTCTPQLAKSTAMPTDAPHTSPTLDGTCTAAAAALVCAAGVCDTTDNKCGYLNSDGPCTAATGGKVCRSGTCDPDGSCGYADGDGPCAAGTGGTVCRSGACSANGTCEPAGACNVDADCSGGNWCNESAHTCTQPLSNGTAMPTDGPHTNPALDGTCTALAASLVCANGVCDTGDNKCGYAVGDGPCTAVGGAPVGVCRSSACSVSGTCEPAGGCNVDADCASGNWCNESAHTCTLQLANGVAMPTDGAHANPTLDGGCTTAAGALVCASGVCDTGDKKCGYLNGDGPCSTAKTAVCRSNVCASAGPNAGLCEPCIDDSACASPKPACDTMNNVCVQCTPGDAFLCIGNLPACDGASKICVVCNGDLGSGASNACADGATPYCAASGACTKCTASTDCTTGTHAGPICDTASGECGTGCKLDSDCAAGNWCNTLTAGLSGVCAPKIANGQPILGGVCASTLGGRACVSGVCDTNDNLCGFKSGDGPCTGANGATVCRSTICATDGPNSGLCVQCVGDAICGGATPICDATTNTCVACNGDDGSGASDECPAGNSAPFCAASGTCGQCSNDTDCTTGAHAGPACNTATGECVSVAEPDGGAPADAGTPQSQDAETPQQDAAGASPPNNISIKGGGCACGTLAGHGGEGGSAAILIVLVAALGAWLARRRARRVSF